MYFLVYLLSFIAFYDVICLLVVYFSLHTTSPYLGTLVISTLFASAMAWYTFAED